MPLSFGSASTGGRPTANPPVSGHCLCGSDRGEDHVAQRVSSLLRAGNPWSSSTPLCTGAIEQPRVRDGGEVGDPLDAFRPDRMLCQVRQDGPDAWRTSSSASGSRRAETVRGESSHREPFRPTAAATRSVRSPAPGSRSRAAASCVRRLTFGARSHPGDQITLLLQ